MATPPPTSAESQLPTLRAISKATPWRQAAHLAADLDKGGTALGDVSIAAYHLVGVGDSGGKHLAGAGGQHQLKRVELVFSTARLPGEDALQVIPEGEALTR